MAGDEQRREERREGEEWKNNEGCGAPRRPTYIKVRLRADTRAVSPES